MTAAIQAVLWDIDGTFALSEELHFDSLKVVSQRYGVQLDPTHTAQLQRDLVGLSALETHTHLSQHHSLSVPFKHWAEQRYHYFRDHAEQVTPRPGTLDVWQRLTEHGLHQALVSNSDRMVVDVNIQRLGLDKPQLISVSRNDVRAGKPDPEPYLRAAYLLGVEPAVCVAIEDTPTGALAALRAGMAAFVWPEDPALNFPQDCRQLEHIAELPALLLEH